MKIFFLTISFLVSSCGLETDSRDELVEYLVRSENNGFSVLIKLAGNFQASYRVLGDLPKRSVIKTNHTDMSHGYFQMEGAHLFRCLGDIYKVRAVKLVWEVPDAWQLANSFGFGSKTQNFRASCRQLADSMFAGGPRLTLTPTRFGVLAMSPGCRNMAELVQRIEINMRRVEEFWNDKPGSYFFVLVNQQITEEPHKNGGSAHLNSFQLQLKGDESGPVLDHLIAHEYIHHWIGSMIKGPPVQNEEDNLDIRWFIEGFTDYFAFELTGTIPVKKSWENISMMELKRNYKNNHTYFDIPYAQGRKIAAAFKTRISKNSRKTLQNFMHDLLARSKRDPGFYITRQSFLQVMCEGQYFDCNHAARIIENYVVQGKQFKSQA